MLLGAETNTGSRHEEGEDTLLDIETKVHSWREERDDKLLGT